MNGGNEMTTQGTTARAWGRGGLVFAGTVMVIIGIFHAITGIAAIIEDSFFVVGTDYAYEIDTTGWGWIHLGAGVLVAITGFFVFTGATWARWLGIFFAVVSAVANFFWLPYYPIWALVIIALDIFVIWALATTSREDMIGRGTMADTYAGAPPVGQTAGAPQSGERWPTNEPAGRHLAPEDAKDMPSRTAGQPQSGTQTPTPTGPSAGEVPPTTPQR
jgi:hypothetical protein